MAIFDIFKKKPKAKGEIFLKPGEEAGTTPGITYSYPELGGGGEAGRVARGVMGVRPQYRGGPSYEPTPTAPTPSGVPEEEVREEPTPTVSPQVEATQERARYAAALGERAREEGVSPQVQATRERRATVIKVRAEAQERGVDISTPTRAVGFTRQLVREQEAEQTIKQEEEAEDQFWRGRNEWEAPLPGDVSFVLEEPVRPTGIIEGLRYDLASRQVAYETKGARGRITVPGRVAFYGLGIGTAALDQILGIKQLVTKPKQTILALPSTIKTEVVSLGAGLRGPTPGYALGRITGFYVGAKVGGKVATKALKKPLLKVGEIKGRITTPRVRVDIITKPKITKTPLSRTFAKDIYAFREGEVMGKKVKVSKPPQVGLKTFQREQRISATKEIALKRVQEQKLYARLPEIAKELKTPAVRKLALERMRESQRISTAKESFLGKLDIERGQRVAVREIAKEPRVLALQKFKQDLRLRPKRISRLEQVRTAKPIEFDIKPSPKILGEIKRLKTGADIIVLDKTLMPRIQALKPRMRVRPRGKPLKVTELRPLIKFDISKEIKGQQVAVGKQQLVLLKPQQIKKVKIKLEVQPKGIQRMFGGAGLTKAQLARYRGGRFDVQPVYAPIPRQMQGIQMQQLMKVEQVVSPKQIQVQGLKYGAAQKLSLRELQNLQTKLMLRQPQPQRIIPITIQAQPPRLIARQRQPQIQRFVPRLAQPQAIAQPQRQLFRQMQIAQPKLIPRQIQTRITKPRYLFKGEDLYKQPRGREGIFKVFLRRFGIFRPVGIAKTPKEAFVTGTRAAGTTLGATFKIEGLKKKPFKIPGYRTKITKKGIFYIEQPKYRLSVPSEVKEIQFFKRMKGGKKKR